MIHSFDKQLGVVLDGLPTTYYCRFGWVSVVVFVTWAVPGRVTKV